MGKIIVKEKYFILEKGITWGLIPGKEILARGSTQGTILGLVENV